MIFSIPVDIKRCILEGIEPPDDMRIWYNAKDGPKGHIERHLPLSKLSAQAKALIINHNGWLEKNQTSHAYSFSLWAFPKFPLSMPLDDYADAINKYAAEWGKER